MDENSLSKLIKDKFGQNTYKKAFDFPTNKLNIISKEDKPIKIRCIVLDEDREFHLIIDEENYEIFHDCPRFLIHSEIEDKICIHILKLLLILKEKQSLKILNEIKKYNLTSEDFGSRRKSENFLILAKYCLDENNYIEALSNLKKSIINQYECEPIIEKYLKTALWNNLLIEFFEFLKYVYENELGDYLIKYDKYIKKGFNLILDAISKYTFYDVLRIIQFIDNILDKYEFKDTSFLMSLIDKLTEMTKSNNFNEKYFSIFLIKKNIQRLNEFKPFFKELIQSEEYESFKKQILNHFLSEIEIFSIIEKIRLMKNHFQIFGIPKKDYHEDYKKYKREIKELKRKVYLRKFAFLKLLMERHDLPKTKIDFRKKRNTYIVNHSKENLKNPVYNYIIKHIGFYGLNESTIKSSEIGINYLIIKELFLDDLNNFPDIFYYKNQFWGEDEDYKINLVDGFSLISKPVDYNYEILRNFSKINDVIIIEWDLANKPRQANIVNAYGNQIIIPDQNNPLFHDLKPFDLCYCQKNPVKIEGNIVKTINVITKCSFKDAINSVSKGMEFIEGYFPLSVIKLVLNKQISPFEADEIVYKNPKKSFIPNYHLFIKSFRKFLFDFLIKERNYIFEELKLDSDIKTNQILSLLNLTTELAGLNLPYTDIVKKLFSDEITLKDFRKQFLEEIHLLIKSIINNRKLGSTKLFDIKKMRNTSFMKYSDEILKIRKEEFENSTIYKKYNKNKIQYDITNLLRTYYGQKFQQILDLGIRNLVNQNIFNKINQFANKLNLKLDIRESKII